MVPKILCKSSVSREALQQKNNTYFMTYLSPPTLVQVFSFTVPSYVINLLICILTQDIYPRIHFIRCILAIILRILIYLFQFVAICIKNLLLLTTYVNIQFCFIQSVCYLIITEFLTTHWCLFLPRSQFHILETYLYSICHICFIFDHYKNCQ